MLKMSPRRSAAGFTLVEMVVVVIVLGILAGLALPSFLQMLRNSEVSTAAESVFSGLQRARAEAVTRNGNVIFSLGTNSGWSITLADGTVVETRVAAEGSANVTVVAKAADGTTNATAITFNNLGQAIANVANLARVDLTAAGGTKNLRVTVGAGGNSRVCDPSLATGSSPRAC